jgi:DUF4097 and DUF4098 domain-containing protein YvlB
LEIASPAALPIVVDTVDASITVSEILAEQRLTSVSGTVETTSFASEIHASTVSGGITVVGNDADARVGTSSVSGRIDLQAVGGEINAENVSGHVSLESSSMQRADVMTVSGNITVAARLRDDGRLRVQTTSGAISLDLGESPGGQYELSTFSGQIDNCFGPRPVRPQFGPPSSTLRFDEEDPRIQVSANTMSGDIVLCKSE